MSKEFYTKSRSNDFTLEQQEPQPTCPDCGHPVSDHGDCGCSHVVRLNTFFCTCNRTPTDLQPEKHCTKCGHLTHLGSCYHVSYIGGRPESCGCFIEAKEQPTQMPLREQLEKIAGDLYAKAYSHEFPFNLVDYIKQLESTVEAHDQQVRREFAAKVEPILLKLWQESNKAKEEISSRRWITDGRGSYKYDDEKYRKEAGLAFDAVCSSIDAMQKSLQEIDKVAHIHAMAEVGSYRY